MNATAPSGKPAYGFDAPGIIGFLLMVGAAALVLAWLSVMFAPFGALIGAPIGLVGFIALLLGCCMIFYGLWGKFRVRDLMLDRIAWRGDEHVLDVGTGAGLLLIGAAKRLKTGRAIGIDIWQAKDLSGNAPETTYRNIVLEGVADRAEARTGDARALDFPDASFDVVLSLLCLHNIEGKAAQAEACREIARVLKPGGVAMIGDYVPTGDYARTFAEAGLTVQRSRRQFLTAYGLMWTVAARKQQG